MMMFSRRVVVAGVALMAAVAACSGAFGDGGGKTHQFDNNTAITIPSIGVANPYPSTITASGINAPVRSVKVMLRGLHHAQKKELCILLVGPAGSGGSGGSGGAGGANVLLMGRVGGINHLPTPNTYIIAQDASPFAIASDPVDGRYAPTRDPGFTPVLTAPAPAGPYGTTLDVFKGTVSSAANGAWSLYVIDQFEIFNGTLAGWSLIIEEEPLTTSRGSIAIPAGAPGTTAGPAGPFPAPVLVDGVQGSVESVRVVLHGLSHTYQTDLRVLLQGPGGQTCLLYSSCGWPGNGWSNAEVIFDDAAANPVPSGALAGPGSYKPTVCNGTTSSFFAPAPSGPYGTTLSVFNSSNPNGVWNLYIEDPASQDSGQISGGWSLIVNGKECKADFNGTGGVTIDDLFLYLNAYFTGCP